MNEVRMSKATLGRLPEYLRYLNTAEGLPQNIAASQIAQALGYGVVQVRKDLAAVSGQGRPKTGYGTAELRKCLEAALGRDVRSRAVLVGAGKLGRALLDYDGFSNFGLEIAAAFDAGVDSPVLSADRRPIYPMEELEPFCRENGIRIGIVTVPKDAAQSVCDRLVQSGITAVWSFAPARLRVPDTVALCQEDLALSLAYLRQQCCFTAPYEEE